jgi:integrase/recombinase XerD
LGLILDMGAANAAPKPRRPISAGKLLALPEPELAAHPPAIARAAATIAGLNKSEHTKRGYVSDLLAFCEWHPAGYELDWGAITYSDVADFDRAMVQRGLKPATRARRLAALGRFYTELVRRGHVQASPLVAVERPRVEFSPADKGLSAAELTRLLEAAEHCGPQAYALVCLLGLPGLRISEALGIDAGQATRDVDGLAVVRSTVKGGRSRTITIGERTLAAIEALEAERTPGEPLFRRTTNAREQAAMARRGEPIRRHVRMSQQLAGQLIAELAAEAVLRERSGKAKVVTPHTLRHTAASLMYDETRDLRAVQEQLGHASPATTQRYDRGRRKEAAAAIAAADRAIGRCGLLDRSM